MIVSDIVSWIGYVEWVSADGFSAELTEENAQDDIKEYTEFKFEQIPSSEIPHIDFGKRFHLKIGKNELGQAEMNFVFMKTPNRDMYVELHVALDNLIETGSDPLTADWDKFIELAKSIKVYQNNIKNGLD